MDKTITLTMDNGSCNNNIKMSVKISEIDLIPEIKKFFRWRKDITIKRLYKQSSLKYDAFIKYLSVRGY